MLTLTAPKVEHRTEQAYAAILTKAVMKDLPSVLPPLFPEMFAWLTKNNIPPAGPPFVRYLSMDKDGQLQLAVGIPVQHAVTDDDRVTGGSFPAGTYASLIHTGSYSHLYEAHQALEIWLDKNGYKDYRLPTEQHGMQFGSRTEYYPTDPTVETNPDKWETEIAFLLKED